MTPTIFVGDLHGNLELFRRITSKWFPGYKFILVGDLLDSRKHNGLQCATLLHEVLDMIESGDVECAIGNHEAGYLYGPAFECSGFNPITAALIMPELSRMGRLMQRCIWLEEEKILVTHAGLSEKLHVSVDELLGYKEKNIHSTPYAVIGKRRGGFDNIGGPLWCDEKEFYPIEGITQIFGHTPGRTIREVYPNNWNIDITEHASESEKQVLKFEDGKFSVENVY